LNLQSFLLTFFNDSFFTRFQGTILEIRKPAGLRTVKESSLQIGKASSFANTPTYTYIYYKARDKYNKAKD